MNRKPVCLLFCSRSLSCRCCRALLDSFKHLALCVNSYSNYGFDFDFKCNEGDYFIKFDL